MPALTEVIVRRWDDEGEEYVDTAEITYLDLGIERFTDLCDLIEDVADGRVVFEPDEGSTARLTAGGHRRRAAPRDGLPIHSRGLVLLEVNW